MYPFTALFDPPASEEALAFVVVIAAASSAFVSTHASSTLHVNHQSVTPLLALNERKRRTWS